MPIPSNIISEIAFLQSQIKANTPLANAPRAQVVAMQLNAAQLVNDSQTALTQAAGQLDTWVVPTITPQIISGVQGLYTSALNQSDICTERGYVGRVASNLDQLP